jgi:hypothetical protein
VYAWKTIWSLAVSRSIKQALQTSERLSSTMSLVAGLCNAPGVVDSRGMSKWSRFAQVAAVKRSLLEVGHPAVHRKQLCCPKILVFHRDLHTSAAPSEHVGIAQDLRKQQVTCLSRDLSCRMGKTTGGWCPGAFSGLGGGDPSPNLHNDSPRTPVTIPRQVAA